MSFEDPSNPEDEPDGDIFALSEVIIDAMDRITARAENRAMRAGIRTGLHGLDELTGGFQRSQLTIIGGRPAMGKTGLALSICEHVLFQEEKAVLYVSLETNRVELAERMLSSKARVDGYKIRTGQGLNTDDMVRLGRAYAELHKAPLWIANPTCLTMPRIEGDIWRLRRSRPIDLIVVNNIQSIEPDDPKEGRHAQLVRICRRLKQLARGMGVSVVALSQLSRDVLDREDHRPMLSDLGNSGALDKEADLVLLLHRPEYYDCSDRPGQADLIIARNSIGPTGMVELDFHKNIVRFENPNRYAETFGDPF